MPTPININNTYYSNVKLFSFNFCFVCYYLTNHNVNNIMYKLFYILIATYLIHLIIKTYIGSLFLNNNYFSLNVNVPTLRTIYLYIIYGQKILIY